jgi:hypothetical protein
LDAARCAFAAAILFAAPQAGAQDRPDIALLRAKAFSIYAPGSCPTAQRAPFDLVLECKFRGKQAIFFLKGNRSQHPPKNAQIADELARELFRQTIAEVDPRMNESIETSDSGGHLGNDELTAAWWGVNGYYKRTEKRVLFRVYFGNDYTLGVALAISELSGPPTSKPLGSPRMTVTTLADPPEEVLTMLGSFHRTERPLGFRLRE